MPERFEDAIKALRHISRGNGNVMRIADRIVAAHERETKVEGVCGPITDELRDAMSECSDNHALWIVRRDKFIQLCDAIDSVHVQLERENDALKAELDRVLRERDEGAIMPPLLDMDDKPIHFGDVMQMDGDSELREVVGFYEKGFMAWLNGRYVPCPASLYRHHVPDTWERIIKDAMQAGRTDASVDVTPLIERCKALAGDVE